MEKCRRPILTLQVLSCDTESATTSLNRPARIDRLPAHFRGLHYTHAMPAPTRQACIGCGAIVPDVDGPTHAYIGASSGCWKIYGDVLAREYGELRNPPWHRLTVDAYAAQHAGHQSRRSIQSVAVHLVSLHLLIDRQLEPGYVTRRLAAAVGLAEVYRWLEPPSFAGAPTVLTVASCRTAEEHEQAVRQWARGVWTAWAPHHATIRSWAVSLG